MAINELHVAGYRSVRDVRLPLGSVNVLVGANGCGKSNLYQSMYLLASAAQGELARTFAAEGGMPSALWAGPTRRKARGDARRLILGVTFSDINYELQCGLPMPPGDTGLGERSLFLKDPEVKEELLWLQDGRSKVVLMERQGATVWMRDNRGHRIVYPMLLSSSESVLSQLQEPHLYPQLTAASNQLRSWRFYHQFRTDFDAPVRQPQTGVRTPILDRDGRDLAAALQTIREVGDRERLESSIAAAFPGSEIDILENRGQFSLSLTMPGIARPFDTRELSDGTLRYLCLLAALLSPRPPAVMALNEPETSLHPELLPPLARLIADASVSSQLWITTHSRLLAEAIEEHSGQPPVMLEKIDGETLVMGRGLLEAGVLPLRRSR